MRAILLCILFSFLACRKPCKDFATAVCKCESTQSEQDSCIQRVNAEAGSIQVTEKEEQACAAIVDHCKPLCEKLQNGELATCGLAVEDP
jgi:hypothetical protein